MASLDSRDNCHHTNFTVGIDAKITGEGVFYEVEPDLAGEKVA